MHQLARTLAVIHVSTNNNIWYGVQKFKKTLQLLRSIRQDSIDMFEGFIESYFVTIETEKRTVKQI